MVLCWYKFIERIILCVLVSTVNRSVCRDRMWKGGKINTDNMTISIHFPTDIFIVKITSFTFILFLCIYILKCKFPIKF